MNWHDDYINDVNKLRERLDQAEKLLSSIKSCLYVGDSRDAIFEIIEEYFLDYTR